MPGVVVAAARVDAGGVPMSVYERVMSVGEWDLELVASTPWTTRNAVAAVGSQVIITPTWVPLANLTDAQMLAMSLFSGLVRRPGGAQLRVGGVGQAGWLGAEDGKGEIFESLVSQTAASLSTWVSAVRPASLTAGTVTSPGGTLTAAYQWVTPRQILDNVCERFGVEWRVRPNFTLDVGTPAVLYGASPAAIATPGETGREPSMLGVSARFAVTVDYDDWASKLILVGKGADYGAGGASTLRDPQGNLLTWKTLVESPETPLGYEVDVATILLAQVSAAARQIEATTPAYAATFDVPVGSYLWLFDPDQDLVDTANRVTYRGVDMFPLLVRVYGCRWPVRSGMGVYARSNAGGGSITWTDLTPWVLWEDGDAVLEVGFPARVSSASLLSGGSSGLTVPLLQQPWESYTPTWTCNSGANPAVGNGTLTGAWRRDGTTLHLRIHTVAGSTTTFGTGAFFYWSLPAGMTVAAGAPQTGGGQVLDSGVDRWGCTSVALAGDTKVFMLFDNAEVGPATPIAAPGTSDEWSLSMTLEIQP